MSKRFVVIVDQSSTPGGVDGYSVFGPYSLSTAESIMGDINGEAMAGEISLNRIIVAPFYEGTYEVNTLTSLLKSQD